MPEKTTYTDARRNLARYWDQVIADREVLVIQRRGAEDVALLPAVELAGIMATAHLLRSPRNANRLFGALDRARAGEGQAGSVEALRQAMNLDEEPRGEEEENS